MKSATIAFGPLSIHWYGIVIAIALLAGLLLSVGMARLRHQRADHLAGILLLGLFSGMIGARAWYFVFRRDYYNPDPGRIFAIWEGGLALHGALVGAMLATLIYTWSREIDFWLWADICTPGLVLGQAIGRVGDLLNNQAFGTPTTGRWAVIIPYSNRPPQYQAYSHFQPTAAYEGAWDAGVCILLLGLSLLQRRGSRVLPPGTIFLAYLVLYSIGRIPIESLRVDSLWVMNLRVAQVASVVFIALGLIGYLARVLTAARQAPAAGTSARLEPSQAYLIAATRGSQPRAVAQTATWQQLPAAELAGNGRPIATAEMASLVDHPVQGEGMGKRPRSSTEEAS